MSDLTLSYSLTHITFFILLTYSFFGFQFEYYVNFINVPMDLDERNDGTTKYIYKSYFNDDYNLNMMMNF